MQKTLSTYEVYANCSLLMLELNIGVHKEFVRDSRVPGGRKDGNLCSKLKMTSKHSLTHQEDSGDEIDDRWSQTLTFEVRQIKCI